MSYLGNKKLPPYTIPIYKRPVIVLKKGSRHASRASWMGPHTILIYRAMERNVSDSHRMGTHMYISMHECALTRTHHAHSHLYTRVHMGVPLHARHVYTYTHTFVHVNIGVCTYAHNRRNYTRAYEWAPTRTHHGYTHLYTRVHSGRHLHACYIYIYTYACTIVRVNIYTYTTRTVHAHAQLRVSPYTHAPRICNALVKQFVHRIVKKLRE